MSPINLLLVEDDMALAGSLADYLSELDFDVDFAYNGNSCIALTRENSYDIIVMDINMPGLNGLVACQQLREKYYDNTPVLFLTARDTLDDKLEGYAVGGDDYLVKPFAPEELVCRLHALMKRGKVQENRQTLGELTLDHQLQIAYRQGEQLDLHQIQFRLLTLLARVAPEPMSRSQLEEALWPDETPESDPLRTHIYRLRQHLDKPFEAPLLLTVHGKGYRLAIPH